MRRLLLPTLLVCTVVAVSTAGTASAFNGLVVQRWAAKIAALGQRPAGRAHERQAAAIVRSRLQALDYTVRTQRFPLPEGGRSLNVVGRTSGPIRVIIVAHMDGVLGTHAANDNASGVGLMLQLAKYLRNEPGMLVAAVGAEERRYTGSSHHLGSRRLARSLSPAQRRGVRLAISLDMVGVGTTLNIRGLERSPNRSARKLLAAARRLGINASYLRDTGQSDHDQFVKVGIPAAWVEWRWDTCWHRPCDRAYRLKPFRLRTAGRVAQNAALRVVG